MSLDEMNAVVAEELGPVPRGRRGSAQNQYRAAYSCYRLNSLGRRPRVHSAAEAREAAREIVRLWCPDVEPTVAAR